MTLLLIYLTIAIGVSFMCSVLEAVLLSITPSYVESAKTRNANKGKALQYVRDNLEKSISCILILNTFAHTMGAAGVGAQATKLFGVKWETLIAVLLTLAILYFSEIIPKTLGANYWRSLAYPAARVIALLIKLVYPLVWLSAVVTRMFGRKKKDVISREEIRAFTTLGYKGGTLARQENELVESILNLRECKTRQILTPRTVVQAFDEEDTVNEALHDELTQRFTRFPVYRDNIDYPVGKVTHRMLTAHERADEGHKPLKELMLPIHRVSEQLPVLQLLDQFIQRKEHLFLVEDRYGQTAGIVTLEDALETLLGREIVDETDLAEDMQRLARERFRERLRRKNKLLDGEEEQQ